MHQVTQSHVGPGTYVSPRRRHIVTRKTYTSTFHHQVTHGQPSTKQHMVRIMTAWRSESNPSQPTACSFHTLSTCDHCAKLPYLISAHSGLLQPMVPISDRSQPISPWTDVMSAQSAPYLAVALPAYQPMVATRGLHARTASSVQLS